LESDAKVVFVARKPIGDFVYCAYSGDFQDQRSTGRPPKVVRSNKARTTKFLSKLLKDTHKTVIDGRSVLPKTAPDITKHKIFLFGCFFLKKI